MAGPFGPKASCLTRYFQRSRPFLRSSAATSDCRSWKYTVSSAISGALAAAPQCECADSCMSHAGRSRLTLALVIVASVVARVFA